jgi:hypothetical protein
MRPTDRPGANAAHPYSVLLLAGLAVPLPLPVARWALTPPFHPYPPRRSAPGGLFSVALSLGLPRAGVTRRHVHMEPGLSSPAAFRLVRRRPPDRLTGKDISKNLSNIYDKARHTQLIQGLSTVIEAS